MAENPWGPDVAPHPLQTFETEATAGTWTLNDSVVFDHTFAAAAVPWTPTYAGGPTSMLFDNWGSPPVGGTTPQRMMMGFGV